MIYLFYIDVNREIYFLKKFSIGNEVAMCFGNKRDARLLNMERPSRQKREGAGITLRC